MTWLVTGGAGFIGSHVVRALLAEGARVVVLDDLSTGDKSRVPDGVPLELASVRDRAALDRVLAEHGITGVVHIAAKKQVGESVGRPLWYFEQNVDGLRVLLEAMAAAGIVRLVFSSSAAVYGSPDVPEITEDTPCAPQSPYGETKLVGEWLIRDTAAAHGLSSATLNRSYFLWRDTNLRVLNEEARRLGTAPAVAEEARMIIRSSADTAILRIARAYDDRMHMVLAKSAIPIALHNGQAHVNGQIHVAEVVQARRSLA